MHSVFSIWFALISIEAARRHRRCCCCSSHRRLEFLKKESMFYAVPVAIVVLRPLSLSLFIPVFDIYDVVCINIIYVFISVVVPGGTLIGHPACRAWYSPRSP